MGSISKGELILSLMVNSIIYMMYISLYKISKKIIEETENYVHIFLLKPYYLVSTIKNKNCNNNKIYLFIFSC